MHSKLHGIDIDQQGFLKHNRTFSCTTYTKHLNHLIHIKITQQNTHKPTNQTEKKHTKPKEKNTQEGVNA